MPPATGYAGDSSAYERTITRIMTPASGHEMMAAGPATFAAFRAPKSHPEPMTLPSAKKVRPMTPTPRLSCGPSSLAMLAIQCAFLFC
jgi:hypothetical protein